LYISTLLLTQQETKWSSAGKYGSYADSTKQPLNSDHNTASKQQGNTSPGHKPSAGEKVEGALGEDSSSSLYLYSTFTTATRLTNVLYRTRLKYSNTCITSLANALNASTVNAFIWCDQRISWLFRFLFDTSCMSDRVCLSVHIKDAHK